MIVRSYGSAEMLLDPFWRNCCRVWRIEVSLVYFVVRWRVKKLYNLLHIRLRSHVTSAFSFDFDCCMCVCVWGGCRVVLLIGSLGGGLIDGLNGEMRGFNAAGEGNCTWAWFGNDAEGGVAGFATDVRDLQAQSGAEERRGEGALAEGRKIYEMIGARALFSWTVVRNKSQSFPVSSA